MPPELELVPIEDVRIGDLFNGNPDWKITGIAETDHYNKPALMLSVGQIGRLIFLVGIKIPVA